MRQYNVLNNSSFVKNFEQDGTSCAVEFEDGTIGRGHWGNNYVHVIDRQDDQVVLLLNDTHYIVNNDYTVNKKDLVKLSKLIDKRRHTSCQTKYRKLVSEIKQLQDKLKVA